eukprot:3938362-Rhodomonas_salina.2
MPPRVLVSAGQSWQESALPTTSLYFPTGHSVQACPEPRYPFLQVQLKIELLLGSEVVPSGHSPHAFRSGIEYSSLPHGWHSMLYCPSANSPAGQTVQLVEPCSFAYVPASHPVQPPPLAGWPAYPGMHSHSAILELPGFDTELSGQPMHSPRLAYFPEAQSEQEVRTASVVTVPAGHVIHISRPLSFAKVPFGQAWQPSGPGLPAGPK